MKVGFEVAVPASSSRLSVSSFEFGIITALVAAALRPGLGLPARSRRRSLDGDRGAVDGRRSRRSAPPARRAAGARSASRSRFAAGHALLLGARRRAHRPDRLVDPAARRARRRDARRRAAHRHGARDAAAPASHSTSTSTRQHSALSTEHRALAFPPPDDDRRGVRGQQPARAGDADAVRRRTSARAPLPVLLSLIAVFAVGILVSMSLFGVALAGVLSTPRARARRPRRRRAGRRPRSCSASPGSSPLSHFAASLHRVTSRVNTSRHDLTPRLRSRRRGDQSRSIPSGPFARRFT